MSFGWHLKLAGILIQLDSLRRINESFLKTIRILGTINLKRTIAKRKNCIKIIADRLSGGKCIECGEVDLD